MMSTEPKRIGKYELQMRLGGGSMGEVWKALDIQLYRNVAIKLIRAELQSDSQFVTRFQHRAQVVASLRHPHIIKIFDVQTSECPETGNTIYMVMDYVEGETLDQYIQSTARIGNFPSAVDIARLFVPTCMAIDYAHHKGVMHRNIKPANILLDQRLPPHSGPRNPIGEPILTDFSVAKLARSATNTPGTSRLDRYHYCSPEQVKGLPGSKQSDLYSLGIILYEICTGVLPFNGNSPTAILTQHLNAKPTSPALINSNIPPALTRVILQSLAKDPADRFPSGTSMAVALCEALNMPISETLRQAVQSSDSVDVPLELSPRNPYQLIQSTVEMNDILLRYGDATGYMSNPGWKTPEPMSAMDTGGYANIPHVSGQPAYMQQRSFSESQAISLAPIGERPSSHRLPRLSTKLLQPLLQRSFRENWRRKQIYYVLLIILTILVITGSFSWLLLSRQTPTLVPPSGIGVIQAPDGESIGISDGTFAFDTQRPGGKLKTQAAEYLRAKDLGSAVSLWQQASTKDTNDAETLTYIENRRILDAGDPYITIVVATTLTGDANSIAIGHANVQAAYVAQKEYNTASKLPGSVKVRLLIANSGSVTTYATTVAQQIVQLAHKDKTIVSVMGWTLTSATLNAIAVLSAAKIPMVTNSGADALTGRSPYFFRVTLPASTQGDIGATYAEKSLHAKTAAVFVDEKNNFVLGLANGFTNRFTGDGNTIVATENYTVGKSGTLSPLLQDALSKHPDVIYFAGYPGDMGGILSKLRPSDPIVLGGSSLYQLEGYSAEARKGLGHLRFTAYSYPDEWEILGLTAQKPTFFTDYKSTYNPNNLHFDSPYGYDRPDGTTLEMYDAISALLYACSNALAEKPIITGSDLQHALTQVTGNRAFQGVTSQISFGPDSNPTERAIVIICVSQGKFLKMDGIYGKFLVGEANRAQMFTPSACS